MAEENNNTDRPGRFGGNKPGAGPIGDCVCPKCGEKVKHQRAKPCYEISCPKCGTKMIRDQRMEFECPFCHNQQEKDVYKEHNQEYSELGICFVNTRIDGDNNLYFDA